MAIKKSEGVTRTEELLSSLCDKTFLKLWSYPNPFKDDRKELCDLIAVFTDHVFIFFDRESRKFDGAVKDVLVTWNRWKKEAIEKQINTAKGAEKYIRSGRPVFLDGKNEVPFPLEITPETKIHKIIVAHGAKEACEAFSDDNVYGSLAVSYGDREVHLPFPFMINLDSNDPVHVLDSHNLAILFGELDTFFDLVSYLEEKERAVRKYDSFLYCGEEDLIAHYFLNFDEKRNAYLIGTKDQDINCMAIGEGEWKSFIEMDVYARRKEANRVSYFWDELIQRTCQNALDGTILGNADLLRGKSALHEMAKEPRFSRRALSGAMIEAIQNFPETDQPLVRNLSFMPSFYQDKGYVFLQLKFSNITDYENDYRPKRQAILEIACGAARNQFPHLNKVIGIAIDAPKYSNTNSEDFILLECNDWTKNIEEHYRKANEDLNFFQTDNLKRVERRVSDFPVVNVPKRPKRKIGRNEPCFCGSGKKYKKCHGA